MEGKETFDQYAIVEIMGFAKLAGRVTEEVIAGHGFVRVDVPSVDGSEAFTRIFGPQAIYCITPVTEEIALRAVSSLRASPVNVYIGNDKQLPSPGVELDEDNDPDLDDQDFEVDPPF